MVASVSRLWKEVQSHDEIKMPAPIVTATAQATIIAALSNISAQWLTIYRNAESSNISIIDFLNFIVLNLLISPPNYLWQVWLEQILPARPDSKTNGPIRSVELVEVGQTAEEFQEKDTHAKASLSWRNTALKWFIDCMTIGALLNTVVFILLMGLLKSRTAAEIGSSLREETIPLMIASYKLWPLASLISFTLVPVEKRIVFLSAVGWFWGIYLSLVAARQ